jgi:hypothetical protein
MQPAGETFLFTSLLPGQFEPRPQARGENRLVFQKHLKIKTTTQMMN